MKNILFAALFLLSSATNIALGQTVISTDKVPGKATNDEGFILYQQNCAVCHNEDRLGAIAPALLPQNLARLKKTNAIKVIREGRVATQMPAFASILTPAQISAVVDFIYQPPSKPVAWDTGHIKASHKNLIANKTMSSTPVFEDDMMNLFIVVETGDHHATLLSGTRFEPIHRFKTHFALHGGPKFSPDGRFVYFASRDGWISKYDIYNLTMVAEIRVGINTRNIAVSHDGRYVMAANYLPQSLVLLDAKDLQLIKRMDVLDVKGNSSRVSAVYTAPNRHSFIVAFKDIFEIWELDYSDVPVSPRRIQTDIYLDDFFFDQDYRYLIGAARDAQNSHVIDLDKGSKIASLALPGMPHLGSGITWQWQNKPIMASPNLRSGVISFIDMQSWKKIKDLDTMGPGFFMRSHDNSPYAWADVFFGPNKDLVHIIDKKSLEIVKTLKPAPGKTAAHIEFTKDGKYALLSIWDMDGAIIVYDAKTLVELKRIPMSKPSGKYNVYNKTHYVRGTSH